MAEIIQPFSEDREDGGLVGDFFIRVDEIPECRRLKDVYGKLFVAGQHYNTVPGTWEGEYIRFHFFDIDPEACGGLRYLRADLARRNTWSISVSLAGWSRKFTQFYVSTPVDINPEDGKVEDDDMQAIYRTNTKGYVEFVKSRSGIGALCTPPSLTELIENTLPQLPSRQPMLKERGDYLHMRVPRAIAGDVLFIHGNWREDEDRYVIRSTNIEVLHVNSLYAFGDSWDSLPSADLVDVLYVFGEEPIRCIFEFPQK